MNIDYIARQIASVDREINAIEKSIHSIDANISRKSKDSNNILTEISHVDITLSFTIEEIAKKYQTEY
jgi:prefoldin subunit 5